MQYPSSRRAYLGLLSNRGVAQPGSAPQWGCGGRRFKSSRPDHPDTVQRPLADRRGQSSPTTLVVGVDAVGPWTAPIGSLRLSRFDPVKTVKSCCIDYADTVQRPLADRRGQSSPTTLVVGVDAVGPWTAPIGSLRLSPFNGKAIVKSSCLDCFSYE